MYNIKGDIGGELKKRREALNITIEEVSSKLKVKAKDIALLEKNSTHFITKHLYVAGLVRSYCNILKIDKQTTEEFLQKISKDCNTKNKRHNLINIDLEREKNPNREYFAKGLIILVVMYLLILSYGKFLPYNPSTTDLLVKQFESIE